MRNLLKSAFLTAHRRTSITIFNIHTPDSLISGEASSLGSKSTLERGEKTHKNAVSLANYSRRKQHDIMHQVLETWRTTTKLMKSNTWCMICRYHQANYVLGRDANSESIGPLRQKRSDGNINERIIQRTLKYLSFLCWGEQLLIMISSGGWVINPNEQFTVGCPRLIILSHCQYFFPKTWIFGLGF